MAVGVVFQVEPIHPPVPSSPQMPGAPSPIAPNTRFANILRSAEARTGLAIVPVTVSASRRRAAQKAQPLATSTHHFVAATAQLDWTEAVCVRADLVVLATHLRQQCGFQSFGGSLVGDGAAVVWVEDRGAAFRAGEAFASRTVGEEAFLDPLA